MLNLGIFLAAVFGTYTLILLGYLFLFFGGSVAFCVP
jgi:hypothetical protein